MGRWFGALVAMLGIILGVVALRPAQWMENLSAWRPILLSGAVAAILVGGAYQVLQRRSVRIFARRKDWWEREIESVIEASTRLVVIDSYQGTKHGFWTALQRRLENPQRFDLTILRLKPDDPFFGWCISVAGVPSSVVDCDRDGIRQLREINAKLIPEKQKVLNFGFWHGVSPGPIVLWTQGSRTFIAFGPWVQVRGCTDLTAWAVVRRGPLFDALKRHCDAILNSYERDT